ncbi:hypothetical protein D3C77_640640 [compost metagenome]
MARQKDSKDPVVDDLKHVWVEKTQDGGSHREANAWGRKQLAQHILSFLVLLALKLPKSLELFDQRGV